MGKMQTTRKLDRNIQQTLLNLPGASFIKGAVFYMALQAPLVHPLRKNSGHALNFTHIVAGDNIRVQAKVHPISAFCGEIVFLLFSPKSLRLGPFHRQVHIPAGMMHTPYGAHSPLESF